MIARLVPPALLAAAIAGCGAASREPARLPQRIESEDASGSGEGAARMPVRIEDPDARWVDPPPIEPPPTDTD